LEATALETHELDFMHWYYGRTPPEQVEPLIEDELFSYGHSGGLSRKIDQTCSCADKCHNGTLSYTHLK